MGKRRRAREFALQILFQHDLTTSNSEDALNLFWELTPADSDIINFTNLLVRGTLEHLKEIDCLITKYSQHWNIKRMAIVDRNVLRFSIFEMLYIKEVPLKVTINEAIEVAKTYGTEDSGKFINGILDKVSKELTSNAKKHDLRKPSKSNFENL